MLKIKELTDQELFSLLAPQLGWLVIPDNWEGVGIIVDEMRERGYEVGIASLRGAFTAVFRMLEIRDGYPVTLKSFDADAATAPRAVAEAARAALEAEVYNPKDWFHEPPPPLEAGE